MNVAFDKSTYNQGDQITVSATLLHASTGSGQAAAGISAPRLTTTSSVGRTDHQCNRPGGHRLTGGGITQTVPLVHVGNGVYNGVFSNTAAGGTYDFTVKATGLLPLAQAPFVQEYRQSVFVTTPQNLNAVLFATNSAAIGENSVVRSGSVIVNRQGSGAPSNPQYDLVILGGVSTPAGFSVMASRILIKEKATVGGNVTSNTLSNNGTIGGTKASPLPLPVATSIPPFESAPGGSNNITVATKKTTTITTGSFGDVVVQPQATLVLDGTGPFNFKSLWVKSQGKVTFKSAAKVRITGELRADNKTYVGPANGTTVQPAGITFYVAGPGSGEQSHHR